jgi:hypothetical protein
MGHDRPSLATSANGRFGPNADAMPAFPAAVKVRFRANAAIRTLFVLDKSDIMVYIQQFNF